MDRDRKAPIEGFSGRHYLLEDGADLAMAQRMADHANPRTTVRYDRREESANLPPLHSARRWGNYEEPCDDFSW